MSGPEMPAYEDFVEDDHNLRMRRVSGEVDDIDPYVCFFYLLARNLLPMGAIEELLREVEEADLSLYTNGWLAMWARDASQRLRNIDQENRKGEEMSPVIKHGTGDVIPDAEGKQAQADESWTEDDEKELKDETTEDDESEPS